MLLGRCFCELPRGSRWPKRSFPWTVPSSYTLLRCKAVVFCADYLLTLYCSLGHVTDHCNLLEEHSRLFHHLSIFERDLKRRTAMQNKRLELLRPIVLTLNRNAYDALHKQVRSACACRILFYAYSQDVARGYKKKKYCIYI